MIRVKTNGELGKRLLVLLRIIRIVNAEDRQIEGRIQAYDEIVRVLLEAKLIRRTE